jgi:NADPH:quinone reductase-like Zn-dependent oxidoreductase
MTSQMPGTWAEQTLAPEGDVVLFPPDYEIPFVQAAAVGMGALVSGDMYKCALIPKEAGTKPFRCLVLGASGGLGTMMLPLLPRKAKVRQFT